jgi:hypothetical protein
MSDDAEALRRIAAQVERAGLRAPVALLLDALRPIDVINSQLARLGLPLAQGTGAEPLLRALAEAESWRELRSLLDAAEPPQR